MGGGGGGGGGGAVSLSDSEQGRASVGGMAPTHNCWIRVTGKIDSGR